MRLITRRGFGKAAAATAAVCSGMTLPEFLLAEPKPVRLAFPKGFVWGCATAAYQVEGGVAEDGRGASIWDTFSHQPGNINHGDNGDVTDDSYHRWKEDVALLKGLGTKGYRFSVAWPRIFPTGKAPLNPKGLEYYDRLVDELLKNGIAPYVTMFHWDLPEALPGGWQSRDTAYAFADYAGFVAKRLGDRVQHFMTTNEFDSFTDDGYKSGVSAPGLKLDAAGVNQVRHHAILAHGLGVQAIRAHAPAGTKVGLAEDPKLYCPVMETPEHIEAVRKAFRDNNAPFLAPILDGKYPDSYLAREGANAPKVAEGDMKAISSPLDFIGMNCYHGDYVRADDSKQGYAIEPVPTSHPHMASTWIRLSPECIYWGVRTICELWPEKVPLMYITENGTSSDDVLTADGRVEDVDRVMYLRAHLTQLHRAAEEGYPVKGYFLWSLMDNFEWSDGFSTRFGIYYVDFKSQKRTPKLSAEWYRATIAANAVE